jgi:rhodanese-related sulfurtransferase
LNRCADPTREYRLKMSASISIPELHQLLQQAPTSVLLDVRTRGEFARGHVPAARNLPMGSRPVAEVVKDLSSHAERGAVYVICQSGGRSKTFADKLVRGGLDHVFTVEGGTDAWQASGFPVARTENARAVFPLERQVRIAAGSLVFASCVLGWQIHGAFFGLAAFVGAGLVFAGISGWCGLGLLLARLPWNR